MDGDCHILGRVVRSGSEGVSQKTLLGVLLALVLLMGILATTLVFSYWRRRRRGELSTPILTQSLPPNNGISKSLYLPSAQALGVCPQLLGRGQPLGVCRG